MNATECYQFSDLAKTLIIGGIYRHYKNHLYQVLYVGRDTETLQEMVIYRALTTHLVWVRSVEMFLEKVCVNGKEMPRFELTCE